VHARTGAADVAARSIETALLRFFDRPRPATEVFGDAGLGAACEEYRARLTRLGLLPDDATKRTRRLRLFVGLLILLGLAWARLWVPLSRGRTNVAFLIILAIVFTLIAVGSSRPFRTSRGNALLADLRALFRRLKDRAPSLRPGATSDMALLAAVFGLAA